jgi:hypothetical protein
VVRFFGMQSLDPGPADPCMETCGISGPALACVVKKVSCIPDKCLVYRTSGTYRIRAWIVQCVECPPWVPGPSRFSCGGQSLASQRGILFWWRPWLP